MKTAEVTTEEIDTLRQSIALLNSMVNGGEDHSETSQYMARKALNILTEKQEDIALSQQPMGGEEEITLSHIKDLIACNLGHDIADQNQDNITRLAMALLSVYKKQAASLTPNKGLTAGVIQLIASERQRQVEKEGWSTEHDDDYKDSGSLALAAASYAVAEDCRESYKDDTAIPSFWPWNDEWWKPTPDNRIKELVKAGALIVAEIERLKRSAPQEQKGESHNG